MTIGEWLAERTPRPPAGLDARIRTVLDGKLGNDARDIPDVFLEVGEGLVAALLQGDSTSRASALDLLTADALVTYAFEAAATSNPGDVEGRAHAAMVRMAALA